MPRHKGESGREARWARKQEGPKTWKKPKKLEKLLKKQAAAVELAKSQTVISYDENGSSSYVIFHPFTIGDALIDWKVEPEDPEAYEQEKLDFDGPTEYAKIFRFHEHLVNYV